MASTFSGGLLAALLLLIVSSLHRTAADQVITLGYLAPFSGAWSGGDEMEPAVAMALEDIAASAQVLPGYRLERLLLDTKCDPATSLKHLFDLVNSQNPKISGLIGPACSGPAKEAAGPAPLFNLAMVGQAPGTMSLSDKTAFPRFLRTTPHHGKRVPLLLKLCEYFGWRRIAVIAEYHDMHVTLSTHTSALARATNVDVVLQEIARVDADLTDLTYALVQSRCSIVVLWGYAYFSRRVICAALRAGKVSRHVWLQVGFHEDNWWQRRDGDNHDCSSDELKGALQGYIALNPDPDIQDDGRRLPSGQLPSEWQAEYLRRSGRTQLSPYPLFAYDSFWTWALALDQLLVQEGASLSQLTADANGLTRTYSALIAQRFYGASGAVQFEAATGDRLGMPIAAKNFVDGVKVKVATFADDTLDVVADIVWNGISERVEGAATGGQHRYIKTGLAFAPPDSVPLAPKDMPMAVSVSPTSVDPTGNETITVVGRNLFGAMVSVFVGRSSCRNAVAVADVGGTQITCTPNSDSFGGLPITVSVNGVHGLPSPAGVPRLDFKVPTITGVSLVWAVDTNEVELTGLGFLESAPVLCRTGADASTTKLGTFKSPTQVRCPIGSSSSALAALQEGGEDLQVFVSQDAGARWSDTVRLQQRAVIRWQDGTTRVPQSAPPPRSFTIGLLERTADTACMKAMLDAVAEINADPDILMDTRLLNVSGFLTQDNDPVVGVRETRRLVEQEAVGMVVGVSSSTAAIAINNDVTTPSKLPFVGTMMSSNTLSSTKTFPYFMRVYPTNYRRGTAVANTLEHFGWIRIATLGPTAGYAFGLLNLIEELLLKDVTGAMIVSSGRYQHTSGHKVDNATALSIRRMVDGVMRASPRPNILVLEGFSPPGCRTIIDELASWMAKDKATREGDVFDASLPIADDAALAGLGLLFAGTYCPNAVAGFFPNNSDSSGAGGRTNDSNNATAALGRGAMAMSIIKSSSSKSDFCGDGVRAAAQGLEAAIRSGSFPRGIFSPGRRTDLTDWLMPYLRNANVLAGKSYDGTVRFNAHDNDRVSATMVFSLQNIQQDPNHGLQAVDVAEYYPSDATAYSTESFRFDATKTMVWPGGTPNRPVDTFVTDVPRIGVLVLHSNSNELAWAVRAAQEINDNPNVLRETKIEISTAVVPWGDEQAVDSTISAFVSDCQQRNMPIGTIIVRGSTMVRRHHRMSAVPLNMLIMSPFANANDLSDPVAFPNYLSTAPSNFMVTRGVLLATQMFNFRRGTVLVTNNDRFSRDFADDILARGRTWGGGHLDLEEVDCSPGKVHLVNWENISRFSPILISTLEGQASWECINLAKQHNASFQVVLPFAAWYASENIIKDDALLNAVNGTLGVSTAGRVEETSSRLQQLRQYWQSRDPQVNLNPESFSSDSIMLLDTISMLAEGADRCLKAGAWIRDSSRGRPLVHELKACVKAKATVGLGGTYSWEAFTNTALSSTGLTLINFRIAANLTAAEASSSLAAIMPKVGFTTNARLSIRLCPFSQAQHEGHVGRFCDQQVVAPVLKQLHPVNHTAFGLRWEHTAPLDVTLLSGYTISIKPVTGDDVEDEHLITVSPQTRRIDVLLEERNNEKYSTTATDRTQLLLPNNVGLPSKLVTGQKYFVRVRALYAQGANSSWSATKFTPANTVCVAQIGTPQTCAARNSEYNSIFQPRLPAREWANEPCPTGAICNGQAFVNIASARGYFMRLPACANEQSAGGAEETAVINPCLAVPALHPCWGPLLGGRHFSFSSLRSPVSDVACRGGAKLERRTRLGTAASNNQTEWAVSRQCSAGYTGMLCAACEDGYHVTPNGCEMCGTSRLASRTLVAVVVFVAGIVLAGTWLILHRPRKDLNWLETALKRSIAENIEHGFGETRTSTSATAGPRETVRDHFLRVAGADKEMDRREFAVFIETTLSGQARPSNGDVTFLVCSTCCLRHKRTARPEQRQGPDGAQTSASEISREAMRLFDEMDWQDQNGRVSWSEFQSFILGTSTRQRKLNTAYQRPTTMAARWAGRAKAWALRPSTSTLVVIILAYLQVYLAIGKQFPMLRDCVRQAPSSDTGPQLLTGDQSASVNGTLNGNVVGAATSTASMSFEDISAIISDAQFAVVGFYSCAVGARWRDVLLTQTLVPVFSILALQIASRLLRKLRMTKGCSSGRILRDLESLTIKIGASVIFITYPSVCRTCLATFNCASYASNTAEIPELQVDATVSTATSSKRLLQVESWLVGDSTVQCSLDVGDGEYQQMRIYSLVVFILFGLGLPIAALSGLWGFFRPVNVLHVPDETGALIPNVGVLGGRASLINPFSPTYWFWGSVEMTRKLILTALLGADLKFATESNEDLVNSDSLDVSRRLLVGAMLAAIMVQTFAFLQPYVNASCNRVAAVVHVVLIYLYIDSAISYAETNSEADCRSISAWRAVVTAVPIAHAFVESIGLHEWLVLGRSIFACCCCRGTTNSTAESGRGSSPDPTRAKVEVQEKMLVHRQHAAVHHAERSTQQMIRRAKFLSSNLSALEQAIMRQHPDHLPTADAKKAHYQLTSIILEAADSVVESVGHGESLPSLSWDHLLGIEKAFNRYYACLQRCSYWGRSAKKKRKAGITIHPRDDAKVDENSFVSPMAGAEAKNDRSRSTEKGNHHNDHGSASKLAWYLFRELDEGAETPHPTLTMTQLCTQYYERVLGLGPRAIYLDEDARTMARREVITFLMSSRRRDGGQEDVANAAEDALDQESKLQAIMPERSTDLYCGSGAEAEQKTNRVDVVNPQRVVPDVTELEVRDRKPLGVKFSHVGALVLAVKRNAAKYPAAGGLVQAGDQLLSVNGKVLPHDVAAESLRQMLSEAVLPIKLRFTRKKKKKKKQPQEDVTPPGGAKTGSSTDAAPAGLLRVGKQRATLRP